MKRLIECACATAAALALMTGAAQAHAHLVGATPAVDGKVQGSPRDLKLSFTEGVVAKLSGVALTDAAGHVIATGPVSADGKVVTVPIKATLAPGAYSVEWHAVAADTHRSTGHFGFTVN